MSHQKKYQGSWRYGMYDICLGLLIVLFPVILLKNFLYAFCYMFLLSSLSSLNVVNISKKISPFSLSSSLINFDEGKGEKTSAKRIERKEFSLFKSTIILICGILSYYVFSVLFGAPVFELYTATLYFSSLMVMLTIYPLLWYFFFSDSIVAVVKIFVDFKCDSLTEGHLYSFTVWTIIGAWFGAFPIPLDWDRPWQVWPITCCIGASLGYSAAHFFMGSKLLHTFFREKKKLQYNRVV